MRVNPQTSPADDRVVVDVGAGQSVRTMRKTVLDALEGRPRDLVIDMREVGHLSNRGLALLVGLRARQRSHQRTLTLVCGSDSPTRQALSRTGLRGTFTTVTESV